MLDLTPGFKFNPPGAGNPGGGDPAPYDRNIGDWTGYFLTGGPLGQVAWSEATIEATIDARVGAFTTPATPIMGSARLTAADTAGKYAVGHGTRDASGGAASNPPLFLPIVAANVPADKVWSIGAWIACNSVAVPGTTTIEVGFFPVTIGGSGSITYTLSDTGKIVDSFAGLVASTINGLTPVDRRDDFAAGDEMYALGIKTSDALPANCVIDAMVWLGQQP